MVALPDHIELVVGEQVTFELPGLGTAGYVWDHEIVGDDGIVDAGWSRGWPAGAPSAPVGVSAPETLTIVARRPGTVELRAFQHRRWEPPDKVSVEHRVTVDVAA
jgi:predicted secreted protein